MKSLIGALFTSILLAAQVSFAQQPTIHGFQAWKTTRVDDARATLERLQQEKSSSSGSKGEKKADAKQESSTSRHQRATRADQRLQQAQLNLEVAQELTINDYFVLYLSQFKQRDAFVGATKKLTPEEAADLMMSYQKHLAGSQENDVVIPATGFGSASLSK